MARLIDTHTIDALAAALEQCGDAPRTAAVPAAVDPLAFVRAGAPAVAWAGYFGTPGGREIGGLGVAWRSVARSGPRRLAELAESVSGLTDQAPLLVGYSFSAQGPGHPEWDGFPAATAVLPMLTVVRDATGGRLIASIPPGRTVDALLSLLVSLEEPLPPRIFEAADHVLESRPPPAQWRDEVDEAVQSIRSGALGKVVLARSVAVRTDIPAAPFDLVSQLRTDYPHSYNYGWQEGDAVLVGASPELLIAREGDRITTIPLAGSAARGANDEEDARLGYLLAISDKDRVEHRYVVDDMAARLAGVTSELHVPDRPQLRRLPTVQHLATEIRGTLVNGQNVLELADLLHPTPAVGGTPREDALAFVEKMESIDRGWYAGGLGWYGPSGDGEIALTLRCGLLRGNTATLYAGAGIVAASDADAELFETRLKFRPMLDLLSAS